MKYNPEIHHRRSIRLKGYEYSEGGAYFVTICTHQRECLFGDVKDGEMLFAKAGEMAAGWWEKIPSKFPDIHVDAYVVMPNHFHGIIVNVGADPRVCPESGGGAGMQENQGARTGAPLHRIIQWFKTMTANEWLRHVKKDVCLSVPGRLWQRNYYERILRNDEELNAARKYIEENPMKWDMDKENPANAPNP